VIWRAEGTKLHWEELEQDTATVVHCLSVCTMASMPLCMFNNKDALIIMLAKPMLDIFNK